jgi:hypothetical protein
VHLRSLLDCACELFRYARVFLWAIFCPRVVLAARLLAVQSQLAACKRRIASKKRPRPRFTAGLRLLWVILSKSLDKWEDLAHLMQPATVKKWHTAAFRCFWRWKSCRKGGRPPISKDMQSLIYQLSKENTLWSAERIKDTLILLQYDPPCEDSQNHLERLLREFIEEYYHVARPHQGLDGDTPVSQTKRPQILGPSKLISVPVLGGLHHRYVRVAA